MTYKLDFLEEALAEWNKLNPSIKQPLKKKLIKVLENPRIPKNKLSGHPNRYKIKLRSIGYREPYRVCRRVNILRDYPDDKTKLYPRN